MKKQIFYLLLLGLILSGCSGGNDFKVDVSDIEVQLDIKRLDQDLFQVNMDSIYEEIPAMQEKYGAFYEIYNRYVISIGNSNSKAYPDNLNAFLTDFMINKAYEAVQSKYPEIQSIEEGLIRGFKHFRYYFPEKQIPAVYTYIGGYNQSIVVGDSILGIGLDKYLGRDYEFYDKLGFSNYLQKKMYKEKIPSDCLHSWAETEWVFNDSIDNVMTNMLYRGKLLYFTRAMFPRAHDTLITGFTGNELQWVQANEQQMWDYLIDKKLLYSTDYMTINKLVNPAPFTSGFPEESPGQAVNWLGWQIIQAYMDQNSRITLGELMEEDDYQMILTESRYHP